MSSEPTYCVYLTTYSGEMLPPYYIGSSSVRKIQSGYRGSVSSKKYKKIWNQELKENPHLFSVEILSLHFTREEALSEELKVQIERDVVKSPLYANLALARENGFFGNEVSGSEHPSYGRKRISPCGFRGHKHSDEARRKMSEKVKRAKEMGLANAMKGKKHKPETIEKMALSHTGLKGSEESKLKRSQTLRAKPDITCPHCGKVGRGAGMHNHHLDKCRQKPNGSVVQSS